MAPKARRTQTPAERAAARLRALTLRALAAPTISLSTAELEAALGDLCTLIDRARDEETAGVWASFHLAFKESGLAGLATLYSIVLRGSQRRQTRDAALRQAHAAVRTKLTSELKLMYDDEEVNIPHSRMADLVSGVVRSQALRCYAALLHEAVSELSERRGRRGAQELCELLKEVSGLIDLLDATTNSTCAAASQQRLLQLAAELGDELLASSVLEHWARGALLLAGFEGQEDAVAMRLCELASPLKRLQDHWFMASLQCKLLLASPSFCYLLASHTVGVCAALDGGSTYGMAPPGAAAAGASAARPAAPAPGASAPGSASTSAAAAASRGGAAPDGGAGRAGPAAATAAAMAAAAPAPVFSAKGLRVRGPHQRVDEGVGTALAQQAMDMWCAVLTRERLQLVAEGYGLWGHLRPSSMSLRGPYRRAQRWYENLVAHSMPGAIIQGVLLPKHERLRQMVAPPLNCRATFALCMRLADAACTALNPPRPGAAAAAVAAGRTAARAGGGARGLQVPLNEAHAVILAAAPCAKAALGSVLLTDSPLAAATAARVMAWWQAAHRMVDALFIKIAAPDTDEDKRAALAESVGDILQIASPRPLTASELPIKPTASVQAAINSRYVGRVYKLAATTELGSRASLSRLWAALARMASVDGGSRAWAQLLAFTDEAQEPRLQLIVQYFSGVVRTLPLTTSNTRLSTAVRPVPVSDSEAYDAARVPSPLTAQQLLQTRDGLMGALLLLEPVQHVAGAAAPEWGLLASDPPAAGGGMGAEVDAAVRAERRAALKQLAAKLRDAANTCLPLHACIVLQLAACMSSAGSIHTDVVRLLSAQLAWVPLLAAAAAVGTDAAAFVLRAAGRVTLAEPPAPSSEDADKARGYWRAYLRDDLPLPWLLGVALGLLALPDTGAWGAGLAERVSAALVALLRLLPAETAAMFTAADDAVALGAVGMVLSTAALRKTLGSESGRFRRDDICKALDSARSRSAAAADGVPAMAGEGTLAAYVAFAALMAEWPASVPVCGTNARSVDLTEHT